MTDDSEAERERVIAAYRGWVVTQPDLMGSLDRAAIQINWMGLAAPLIPSRPGPDIN
jgi:hypothetical protein